MLQVLIYVILVVFQLEAFGAWALLIAFPELWFIESLLIRWQFIRQFRKNRVI